MLHFSKAASSLKHAGGWQTERAKVGEAGRWDLSAGARFLLYKVDLPGPSVLWMVVRTSVIILHLLTHSYIYSSHILSMNVFWNSSIFCISC